MVRKMAKAGGKTIKSRRRRPRRKSPEELPLDDPRWIRIANLHQALVARLGNSLAANEITKKLEDGSLPCLQRCISYSSYYAALGPERNLVPLKFWSGYQENDRRVAGHRVAYLSSSPLGAGRAYVVNRLRGQGIRVLCLGTEGRRDLA
jgi:hypothetical protein